MKSILSSLVLLLCIGFIPSQAQESTDPDKAKIDSLMAKANQLFEEAMTEMHKESPMVITYSQRFQEAAIHYQMIAEILEVKSDTLSDNYFSAHVMASRCLIRLEQYDEAIAHARIAAEKYINSSSYDPTSHCFYIDNLSMYLNMADKHDEAESYSNQAVKMVLENDSISVTDKRAILIHAAEIKYEIEKFKEAITLQQYALNIISADEGVHSERYIFELQYMIKYQEAAGNTEKVEELKKEVEVLQDEMENGFVSAIVNFDTPEKCTEHNYEAYYCCKYYLNHYFSAPKMQEAYNYIMTWSIASPDVSIIIGEKETKMVTEDEGYVIYLCAYMAGCSMYALTTEEVDEYEQYSEGIIAMLNAYNNNKEQTGHSIKQLDKLISLYQKSPEKMYAQLHKDFAKIKKSQK